MDKGDSAAPDPDPNVGKAAMMQSKLGMKWLNFAKQSYEKSLQRQRGLDNVTKDVTSTQLGMMRDQNEWSRDDRARYEETFRPIEDKFIKDALAYGTPERQAEVAAEAKGDVRSAAQVQKQISERESAAMGIDPTSGRYAGIDRAGELNTALAEAGAANNARSQVRDKALALTADAANFGRGLPTQSAQSASLGLNSGNSALAGRQQANQMFMQGTDIMSNGYRGAIGGYAGEAQTLNQQYGLQLDAWRTQQQIAAQNAAGIGQAVGGIAGLIFSDENVKENKEEIPEGDALEAVNSMPVEEWDYKPGVADGGRHVGTYAQDFQRSTGKGDGRTIPAQDAIGITMKAVQDLDKKIERIADAIGLTRGGENSAAAQPGLGLKKAA